MSFDGFNELGLAGAGREVEGRVQGVELEEIAVRLAFGRGGRRSRSCRSRFYLLRLSGNKAVDLALDSAILHFEIHWSDSRAIASAAGARWANLQKQKLGQNA